VKRNLPSQREFGPSLPTVAGHLSRVDEESWCRVESHDADFLDA